MLICTQFKASCEYARRVVGAIQAGETFRHTFQLQDGRTITLCNKVRRTGGWVTTHEDITWLKQRDDSFRLLFDNNPVPMWVHDEESLRFLAVNDTAVETQAQLDFLTQEACQEVQGYFIGRPCPIADYAELVGRTAARRATALAS